MKFFSDKTTQGSSWSLKFFYQNTIFKKREFSHWKPYFFMISLLISTKSKSPCCLYTTSWSTCSTTQNPVIMFQMRSSIRFISEILRFALQLTLISGVSQINESEMNFEGFADFLVTKIVRFYDGFFSKHCCWLVLSIYQIFSINPITKSCFKNQIESSTVQVSGVINTPTFTG